MSDMIIRNARLLDPASGRDETGDIGVVDGVFSAAGACLLYTSPSPRD